MIRNATFAVFVVLAAPLALAAPGEGRGGGLKKADANQDGVISRAEAKAERGEWFAKADANKDGFVTAGEVDEMREKARRERQEREIARLDTNKDGRVSKAEFDASPMPRFDRLDANKDGVIDRSELAQARERRGERRQQP